MVNRTVFPPTSGPRWKRWCFLVSFKKQDYFCYFFLLPILFFLSLNSSASFCSVENNKKIHLSSVGMFIRCALVYIWIIGGFTKIYESINTPAIINALLVLTLRSNDFYWSLKSYQKPHNLGNEQFYVILRVWDSNHRCPPKQTKFIFQWPLQCCYKMLCICQESFMRRKHSSGIDNSIMVHNNMVGSSVVLPYTVTVNLIAILHISVGLQWKASLWGVV